MQKRYEDLARRVRAGDDVAHTALRARYKRLVRRRRTIFGLADSWFDAIETGAVSTLIATLPPRDEIAAVIQHELFMRALGLLSEAHRLRSGTPSWRYRELLADGCASADTLLRAKCEELVLDGFKSHDPDLSNLFVELVSPSMRARLRALNLSDKKDALQAAWTKLTRPKTRQALDGEQDFRAYISTTTSNVAKSLGTRSKSTTSRHIDVDPDTLARAEHSTIRAELTDAVRLLADVIAPHQVLVWLLVRLPPGDKPGEIARREGSRAARTLGEHCDEVVQRFCAFFGFTHWEARRELRPLLERVDPVKDRTFRDCVDARLKETNIREWTANALRVIRTMSGSPTVVALDRRELARVTAGCAPHELLAALLVGLPGGPTQGEIVTHRHSARIAELLEEVTRLWADHHRINVGIARSDLIPLSEALPSDVVLSTFVKGEFRARHVSDWLRRCKLVLAASQSAEPLEWLRQLFRGEQPVQELTHALLLGGGVSSSVVARDLMRRPMRAAFDVFAKHFETRWQVDTPEVLDACDAWLRTLERQVPDVVMVGDIPEERLDELALRRFGETSIGDYVRVSSRHEKDALQRWVRKAEGERTALYWDAHQGWPVRWRIADALMHRDAPGVAVAWVAMRLLEWSERELLAYAHAPLAELTTILLGRLASTDGCPDAQAVQRFAIDLGRQLGDRETGAARMKGDTPFREHLWTECVPDVLQEWSRQMGHRRTVKRARVNDR